MATDKKNEAFAAFVIACDENHLELYYEREIYTVQRNKEVSKKKKGDWVWFQLDQDKKTVVAFGDMPRRWNSRLSPDGQILWLEDPDERLHRKRGIRLGKMHEVTVKVVVDEDKAKGEDDVSFQIIEVHYESPDEIQLEMAYSPWVQLLLTTVAPVEGGNIDPVRTRELGKLHMKNRDYGVILRSRDGRLFVWSNDSGLLFVACNRRDQYAHLGTGDFVLLKRVVRNEFNDIAAKKLEKANRSASRTKVVERRHDLYEALVETRFTVPEKEKLTAKRFLDHYDSFLGMIRIHLASIERLLENKGVTMENVYGKRVRAWAGPANMQAADARAANAAFWTIEEMFDYPPEFDDDDFEDTEVSDSDTDDERMEAAREDDEDE